MPNLSVACLATHFHRMKMSNKYTEINVFNDFLRMMIMVILSSFVPYLKGIP